MSNSELIEHRVTEIESHASKMAASVEEMARTQIRAENENAQLSSALQVVDKKVDKSDQKGEERHKEIMAILTGDGKKEIGYLGRLTRIEDTIKLVQYCISAIFVAILALLGHLVLGLITGKK